MPGDLLERSGLMAELDGALAASAVGGQIVLVAGEACIGKSALVRDFARRGAGQARHRFARRGGRGRPPGSGSDPITVSSRA